MAPTPKTSLEGAASGSARLGLQVHRDPRTGEMIRAASTALLVGLGLLVSRPAMSDDGAIEAVGGAVRAMRNHPTIEMTAEFVHATVSADRVEVECVFWLRNRGPATHVTVGFPCESSGDVPEATPFKEFHSYLDGHEIAVRVLPDSSRRGDSVGSWWVKDIAFAGHETKCVRNTYVAEPGTNVDLGYRGFEYILWTGASWFGPIGIADIVITFEGGGANAATAMPPPTARTKSELSWHFVNLEPDDTRYIEVGWHVKASR